MKRLALVLGLAAQLLGCVVKTPGYCDDNNPCPAGQRCNNAKRACEAAPDGGRPEAGVRERSVREVTVGEASAREVGPDSRAPEAGGNGDLPVKLALGASCLQGSQCASGFCADKVCCESACGGKCQSCAVAGSPGKCTSVPDGQDPDGECAGKDKVCAGSCDGKGSCSFAAKQGKECAATTCTDGLDADGLRL
jgi:hypothetical protein